MCVSTSMPQKRHFGLRMDALHHPQSFLRRLEKFDACKSSMRLRIVVLPLSQGGA